MEEKKYIIFFNLESPIHLTPNIVETLQTRISKIGKSIQVDKNVYVVESKLRAFEIYSGLGRELANVEILVCEINMEDTNVCGAMPTAFWKFLNIKTEDKDNA